MIDILEEVFTIIQKRARAGPGAVEERTLAKMKAGPRGEVTLSFNGVGDAT